jgi:hypothetical protein
MKGSIGGIGAVWTVDQFDCKSGEPVPLEWIVRNDDFEVMACCPSEDAARLIADLLNYVELK